MVYLCGYCIPITKDFCVIYKWVEYDCEYDYQFEAYVKEVMNEYKLCIFKCSFNLCILSDPVFEV